MSFVDNGNFYTRWGKHDGVAKEWPGYLREDGRHSSYTIQDNLLSYYRKFHFNSLVNNSSPSVYLMILSITSLKACEEKESSIRSNATNFSSWFKVGSNNRPPGFKPLRAQMFSQMKPRRSRLEPRSWITIDSSSKNDFHPSVPAVANMANFGLWEEIARDWEIVECGG